MNQPVKPSVKPPPKKFVPPSTLRGLIEVWTKRARDKLNKARGESETNRRRLISEATDYGNRIRELEQTIATIERRGKHIGLLLAVAIVAILALVLWFGPRICGWVLP